MDDKMIPIFTSQYSGKSILTFDSPEDAEKNHKQSIFKLCLNHNIDQPFIVEDKMTGFMEMYQNAEKLNIKPRFGLRYRYNSGTDEEEDQKIVIFCNNTEGYKRLIKIHNTANKENGAVISPKILEELWSDDLTLCIPFYDSYLYNNIFGSKPSFPPSQSIERFFFVENNSLPMDIVLENAIPKENRIQTKSILYEKEKDFDTWLTYRCALNLLVGGKRRSLQEPFFDHCSSNKFSFESFLNENNNI